MKDVFNVFYLMQDVLDQLRSLKFRITPIRKAILEIFLVDGKNFSVADLKKALKRKKCLPNKTTLYREVGFLLRQNIIRELTLGSDKKYYEWVGMGHHHHVVCQRCNDSEDVELKDLERLFPKIESQLQKMTKFKHIDHSLEFFGLCSKCASN